ncbi:hypothetical protein F5B19DRAFT_438326 [Rostrohypoxylon terebratum]|nr:hypothetical protein F5B19DRAFT_438326 [Rostrohypoxylon terebratum]
MVLSAIQHTPRRFMSSVVLGVSLVSHGGDGRHPCPMRSGWTTDCEVGGFGFDTCRFCPDCQRCPGPRQPGSPDWLPGASFFRAVSQDPRSNYLNIAL